MKKARIERVMANMRKAGLEQIVVSETESVFYLTGLWIKPGERMLALRVDQSGDVALYVNRMFRAAEQATGGLKVVEFDDVDDPAKLIAADLKPGVVGIDKFWPSQFAIGVMNERKDIRLTVGSAPVDDARMLKDAEEIERMRVCSHMNDRAVGALIKTLRAGDTERGVGRRYSELAIAQGGAANSFDPLVCFGANCAEPHHNTDDTVLRGTDSVILDLGMSKDRYISDMTRTVFLGRATDEEKKVYEIVLRANMAAKKAVRPGIPMKEIDRAARSVIEDAGYGKYFLHRTGHGVGLAVHEPTDASATNETIAQPGMCFSIEPGIYLSGKFGVRIEDLVCVTEDGVDVFNELDRELIEISDR